MAVARATGRVPPELVPPPFPPGCEALWQAFLELHAARGAGMGAQPITLHDLLAWQQLMGVRLTPWEAETLLAVDRAVLNQHAENDRSQERPSCQAS